MEYGDYIIYVDESGDHGLMNIDQEYPVFVLAFCIIKKTDYVQSLVPAVQELKFRWFGHDIIVLHEHEIRRRNAPFVFLADREKRERFMGELSTILEVAPMKVIPSIIRKDQLRKRYFYPNNPYHLALLFCMERAAAYLAGLGQEGRLTHIVCESRGGSKQTEDKELELEFRRIAAGANPLQGKPITGFDVVFADKRTNSTGLQIADLVARPIGIRTLRPGQPNRAYELLPPKIWDRKVFP